MIGIEFTFEKPIWVIRITRVFVDTLAFPILEVPGAGVGASPRLRLPTVTAPHGEREEDFPGRRIRRRRAS